MRDGLRFARERPIFTLALVCAWCAPVVLGLVPLDRALAPLLDLRPAARLLLDGDDSMWMELVASTPSLPGTALGSAVVAFLLSVPTCWLVAAFTTASALPRSPATALVAARGITTALVMLPVRALPLIAAVLVGLGARETQTLRTTFPYVLVAGTSYLVGSAVVAVLGDFVRAAAVHDPEQSAISALVVGLRAMVRRRGLAAGCVVCELAFASIPFAALAITRPLGLFDAATYAVGVSALVLRAFGTTALVATATRAVAN
jgi:hypothetical protein